MHRFSFMILVALMPLIHSTLPPAADCRTYFGPEFYRRSSYEIDEDYKGNYMVSPASVQKFLTLIYQGTAPRQADRMLFDYGVKHLDMKRFRDIVREETGSSDTGRSMETRKRLMNELNEPCSKEEVVEYFKNDFSNTKDSTEIKNYIVAPETLTPKTEYTDFAQNYFNTKVIDENSDEANKVQTTFGDNPEDPKNIQLYCDMSMTTKLNDSYTLANGNINAVMEAKYSEDEDMQYIDLPLENGFTLFIALADNPKELSYYATQVVGRRVQNFKEYADNNMEMEKVLVQLPPMKVECVNDLTNYFKTGNNAREGVKTMLTKNAKMTEAFENWPENGPKVENFKQRVAFELKSADNTDAVNGPPEKTFDAIGKPFFFVVKSDKVFYIMGHYNGAEE